MDSKNKTEHTPGPWEWDGANKLCGKNGQTVAIRARAPYAPSDYKEDCANQRLLSVAPELLEAAKQVSKDIDIQFHGGRAIDYLKHLNALTTAIAKAEGK